MATARFKTTGMHCPSCTMLIEMNVGELTGVLAVRSELASGTTEVVYDEAAVSASIIEQTIREAGYGAELVA
jgi:copper chaperone CopZ